MTTTAVAKKRQIKKLLVLNEELENYFRNTIIPQLFVDANLILRKYSPPANLHFKFLKSDIGKPIRKIPSLLRIPGVVETILEVIESNVDLEKEVQMDDGKWFQMNILPYIIKKENVTNGVVLTFVDITDRINDKKDIERLIADHETFIYSVSHDFRGPLNNLVMLIKILNDSYESGDKEEFNSLIQLVDKSARAMEKMITELTETATLGKEVKTPTESIPILRLLEEVKFTLKNEIHHSHAKITTDFLVPDLKFSRKNLRSILYNLLSNAIKFAAPGRTPEITIKTAKSGKFTLLTVSDNGMGIEEGKETDIFSKFVRLRPEVEGTGLGLYIVGKMISNNGGKIEVESKPKKGTTFYIYLNC